MQHDDALTAVGESFDHFRGRGEAKLQFLDRRLVEIGKEHEPPIPESAGKESSLKRIDDQCLVTRAYCLTDKPIDRRRLEAKAADYVRDSVRRVHEKRAGGLV